MHAQADKSMQDLHYHPVRPQLALIFLPVLLRVLHLNSQRIPVPPAIPSTVHSTRCCRSDWRGTRRKRRLPGNALGETLRRLLSVVPPPMSRKFLPYPDPWRDIFSPLRSSKQFDPESLRRFESANTH